MNKHNVRDPEKPEHIVRDDSLFFQVDPPYLRRSKCIEELIFFSDLKLIPQC